jgi:hypothetical protein
MIISNTKILTSISMSRRRSRKAGKLTDALEPSSEKG